MLWKVNASGGQPEVLPAGPDAYSPSVSSDGRRVVYSRRRLSVNLWRVPIEGEAEPERVIRSVRSSVEADYSPNGRRVVFTSDQRGAWDIWIADADGGKMGRLVAGRGGQTSSPRWSPDGGSIAFASRPDGNADIFVAPSDGRGARRVVTSPSEDSRPTWSRDGRFLYFVSDRSGRSELWKVSALGGEPSQVTHKGAEFGLELEDGETILYLSGGVLWRRSLSESGERKLATGIRDFVVRGDHVYFTPITHSMFNSVERISIDGSGRSIVKERIGPQSGMPAAFTVSPDGNWLLFDRIDQDESELLVLER
jgi:Tol biopolymer transport system component